MRLGAAQTDRMGQTARSALFPSRPRRPRKSKDLCEEVRTMLPRREDGLLSIHSPRPFHSAEPEIQVILSPVFFGHPAAAGAASNACSMGFGPRWRALPHTYLVRNVQCTTSPPVVTMVVEASLRGYITSVSTPFPHDPLSIIHPRPDHTPPIPPFPGPRIALLPHAHAPPKDSSGRLKPVTYT